MNQRRDETRSLEETLDRAWQVASELPRRELTMVSAATLEQRYVLAAGAQPPVAEAVPVAEPLRTGRTSSEKRPPGSRGRLWLLDKLAGARRSSDLLEQKREVLLREYARVSTLADASRVEWENACREAERWALRLALLGGQRELNVLATGRAGRAELEVVWKSSMGLDQPEEGRCVLPVAQRLLDVSGNAAGAAGGRGLPSGARRGGDPCGCRGGETAPGERARFHPPAPAQHHAPPASRPRGSLERPRAAP